MGALTDLYNVGAFKKRGAKAASGDNNAASMPGSTGDPDPTETTKQRGGEDWRSADWRDLGAGAARLTKRAFSKRR